MKIRSNEYERETEKGVQNLQKSYSSSLSSVLNRSKMRNKTPSYDNSVLRRRRQSLLTIKTTIETKSNRNAEKKDQR